MPDLALPYLLDKPVEYLACVCTHIDQLSHILNREAKKGWRFESHSVTDSGHVVVFVRLIDDKKEATKELVEVPYIHLLGRFLVWWAEQESPRAMSGLDEKAMAALKQFAEWLDNRAQKGQ